MYLCLASSTPPYNVHAFVTFYGSLVNLPSCLIDSPCFIVRSVERCPLPHTATILDTLSNPQSPDFKTLKSLMLAKLLYSECFNRFFFILGLNSLIYLGNPDVETVFIGFGSFSPSQLIMQSEWLPNSLAAYMQPPLVMQKAFVGGIVPKYKIYIPVTSYSMYSRLTLNRSPISVCRMTMKNFFCL